MSIRSKKKVGLIIKNNYLIAVEVENTKTGPILSNYSKVYLEDGIIENGMVVTDTETFKHAIHELLAKGIGGSISGKNLCISLPDDKIFEHELVIPKAKINDENFIKNIAKDFIPIELNDSVFDYKITGEDSDGKNFIINFVAAQSTLAQSLIDNMKLAGINIVCIDVDSYSFMRMYDNHYIKNGHDTLMINMDPERDLIAIKTIGGSAYKTILYKDSEESLRKAKAVTGLSTNEEVMSLLLSERNEQVIETSDREAMITANSQDVQNIQTRIENLIAVVESKENIKIERVFIAGPMSRMPGIVEMLQQLFPSAEIKNKVEFMSIPNEIEDDVLEGIGLCIQNEEKEGNTRINLLTESRKDELIVADLMPRLKKYLLFSSTVLMLIAIWVSIQASKDFLQFKISAQEAIVLNEQALNPYITGIVKKTEKTRKLERQIISIMDDTIPVTVIMNIIDNLNTNGTSIVNFSFLTSGQTETIEGSLRAKTANRSITEKLVEDLEAMEIFSEVSSPLSNLVGKGERFINIQLTVDRKKAIEIYNADKQAPVDNEINPETTNNE